MSEFRDSPDNGESPSLDAKISWLWDILHTRYGSVESAFEALQDRTFREQYGRLREKIPLPKALSSDPTSSSARAEAERLFRAYIQGKNHHQVPGIASFLTLSLTIQPSQHCLRQVTTIPSSLSTLFPR